MVYKRTPSPPPRPIPVNLDEFDSQADTTSDDLVRIDFENGQRLYVFQGVNQFRTYTWYPDKALRPQTINEIIDQWRVRNPYIKNAWVGRYLRIDFDGPHWKTDVWFTTSSRVSGIKSTKRPRKTIPVLGLDGGVDSFTSDDYH